MGHWDAEKELFAQMVSSVSAQDDCPGTSSGAGNVSPQKSAKGGSPLAVSAYAGTFQDLNVAGASVREVRVVPAGKSLLAPREVPAPFPH